MNRTLALLPILAALLGSGSHSAEKQSALENDPRLRNFDPSKLVRFTTPAQADAKRMELIRYIWRDGLPVKTLPQVTVHIGAEVFTKDLIGLDGKLAASVDRLDATIAPYDFHSISYLIHPIARSTQSGRLVIVHSGHRRELTDWAGEDAVIDRLLSQGYTVLAMDLPLFGWNANNLTVKVPKGGGIVSLVPYDHQAMFDKLLPLLPNDGTIFRFFLEPEVQGVNYFLQANPSGDVSMIGLSGGGWSTHMAAAVDVRIKRSFPVAGSYPLYARSSPFPTFSHDIEQYYAPLYRETDSNGDGITDTAAGVASWLEIFVLGGYGSGRRQTQILNYYDSCCFFGDAFKTYTGFVSGTVRHLGSGEWDFHSDTTHKLHQISGDVLDRVIMPGLMSADAGSPKANATESSSDSPTHATIQ
jgi:pimeloyl-ACP methyl ester carboxylesterase